MGAAGLLPGVHDLDATQLAPQLLAAARAQGRAGRPPEQGEEGALGGHDEGRERLRERKDAVEIRHGPACGLAVCAPRRLGQGVPRGAVALAA
jgi:hypothetical protein